ncbi:response regulator transcription factor [Geitlerinema sp. P-1104]|uniref:response regulator transcription factor NblR n=1 Tax=Geitlerinema sp. P-1104 TaxID=2546230 RepID=UPI0014772B12|nr:response regulator transcription factor [Geitlerinema sp. P-1104]NMG60594.1 response regulator transcription factor [Geitlerinema sp. P-1104]
MDTVALELQSSVLVVEPDTTLAQRIALDLQEGGYEVAIAHEANHGLHQVEEMQPGLIAINRILPGNSGLWLCKHLRSIGNRAVVMMMLASDTLEDRVACLEAGADDYVIKPYRSYEFLKMVAFYLKPEHPDTNQLRFADLLLDLPTRQAFRGGRTGNGNGERAIDLTMKEFELLKYLMEHPREVLTREQILENVWGYEFMGESNVIEVYIRYLRLKIENEGDKRLIQTVRGVGYVLRDG